MYVYIVWTKEERGEGSRGESGYGTSVRRLPDPPQKGHPSRLRDGGRRGRGEHSRHRSQIPARTSAGHV